MPGFKHHIFICENQRDAGDPRGCCMDRGAKGLRAVFKEEIEKHGLRGVVRANKAGCLDHCEFGPTVVVYPKGVWYWVGDSSDVKEIVEKHIVGGEVVERLLLPEEFPSGDSEDDPAKAMLENLPMQRPSPEIS